MTYKSEQSDLSRWKYSRMKMEKCFEFIRWVKNAIPYVLHYYIVNLHLKRMIKVFFSNFFFTYVGNVVGMYHMKWIHKLTNMRNCMWIAIRYNDLLSFRVVVGFQFPTIKHCIILASVWKVCLTDMPVIQFDSCVVYENVYGMKMVVGRTSLYFWNSERNNVFTWYQLCIRFSTPVSTVSVVALLQWFWMMKCLFYKQSFISNFV